MPDRNPITRRRAITVIAGGACALLGGSSRPVRVHEWRGTALGADAHIVFAHSDKRHADRALLAVHQEIERLENIFSLFRPHAAVCKLNRTGVLDPAPLDLLHLTRRALALSAATDGAFDITVQPLWDLYAAHFRAHPGDTSGPPAKEIDAARRQIGSHNVRVTRSGIRLSPGTRLTFNGIAQGYVTDRVSALLRSRGWHDVLINAGEFKGLGTNPDGQAWRIALPGGGEAGIADLALATSAGDGTRFSSLTPHHHLFDPRSGLCAQRSQAVCVTARYATDADALSTALFVAPRDTHRRILSHVPGARLILS